MAAAPIPIHIKLVAFVFMWHEVANCFGHGADAAFSLTLVLFLGAAVVRLFRIELAGMGSPLTAAFLTRGALWLVIYLWLAPGFLRSFPASIIFAAVVCLTFAGAWARDCFFVWLQDIDGQWFRDRSETIVSLAMGAVAMGFISSVAWGSILPMLGYVLLPGLPLSCGWLARTPEAQWRWDATFGSEEMFHDVGASDEV